MDNKGYDYSDILWAVERVLEVDMDDGEVRPPPGQFENIIKNLEIKRGKRRLKRMAGKVGMACVILLVLSTGLYIFFPEKVTEGCRRLINSVTHFFPGNIRIEVLKGDHFLSPALEGVLDGFQEAVPFDIRLPGYVPPGYRVTDAFLEGEGRHLALTLVFSRGGDSFSLTQGGGIPVEGPGGGRGPEKIVEVPGGKGTLIRGGDGRYALGFQDHRGVVFLLEGNLGEEELLEVALSLK